MNRKIIGLAVAALAAVPTGGAWLANALPAAAAAATHTYKGPYEYMRFGRVRAIITVKGTKITKVKVVAPGDNPRSAFINRQAVPILQQETLHAQSANIDWVSGATLTSDAYTTSLQQVLKKHHLKVK